LTFSLYFKAYKNGYKELAFIILFLLLILYIPSLGVVFILTPVQRPCSRYVFPSTIPHGRERFYGNIFLVTLIMWRYEGPGQKYGDYRPSDAEGPLKHRIKIAYTR
jgi:hypothetical protein